jgi:hypothetical protein
VVVSDVQALSCGAGVPGEEAMTETKRETRMLWVVENDEVVHVQGFSCAPDNPDYWWIPAIGYSTSRVHATEDAAKGELRSDLKKRIAEASALLTKLG